MFWSSDVVAFEVLARDQLLQKAPEVANPAVPKLIGTYPMNDPGGYYFGQALSGYGMMMNTRYLAAKKLPAPKEWADLTKGIYFGHIGISTPSRSGTTHLNVETILFHFYIINEVIRELKIQSQDTIVRTVSGLFSKVFSPSTS